MNYSAFDEENITNLSNKLSSFRNKYGLKFDSSRENNFYYIFSRAFYDDITLEKKQNIEELNTLKLIFGNIDQSNGDLINIIRDNFTKKELGYILSRPELFDAYVSEKGKTIYIYQSVLKLIDELLKINKDDIIYNPFSGYGEFIEYINRNYPGVFVEAEEISSDLYEISELRNSINSTNFKIKHTNPLTSSPSKKDFNKIFTLPEIGRRNEYLKVVEDSKKTEKWLEKNNIDKYESMIYIIKNILEVPSLERGIYIYPTGKLSNYLDSKILRQLIDSGYIEGIIQLPERMFKGTNISFSIIIISKENKSIKLVDASEFYEKNIFNNVFSNKNIENIVKEYENPNKIAREFSIEEIKNNGYIVLPKRAVVPKELVLESYYSLKDIASIQRGVGTVSRKELEERFSTENNKMKYIQASDLSEDLHFSILKSINKIEDVENRYLVRDKDILISKVQNFKSMIIDDINDYKILVSGNLYRVYMNEDSNVNPYYVQAYLDTDHAKEQILRLTSGTSTSILSVSSLEQLRIPKVSKEKQEKIAKDYINIIRRIKITNKQLKLINDQKNIIFEEVL